MLNNIQTSDITVTIISVDTTNQTAMVQPYCTFFKKPSSEYQYYNISYSDLDPSKDLATQLATKCYGVVNEIYISENNDIPSIENLLVENINNSFTVNVSSAITPINQTIYAVPDSTPAGTPLYSYQAGPNTTVITTISSGLLFKDGTFFDQNNIEVSPLSGGTFSGVASGYNINFIY